MSTAMFSKATCCFSQRALTCAAAATSQRHICAVKTSSAASKQQPNNVSRKQLRFWEALGLLSETVRMVSRVGSKALTFHARNAFHFRQSRQWVAGNDILGAPQIDIATMAWIVRKNYFSNAVTAGVCNSSGLTIHFFSSCRQSEKNLLCEMALFTRKGRSFTCSSCSLPRFQGQLYRMRPFMLRERNFARIASPPPHLQRQMGMKLYQGSSGIVIDPYHVRSSLPFFQRWFTREGWKQIREYMIHELKSAYAIAKLRQKAGYTKKKFYTEACTLYKQINSAIALGDRNTIKQFVTDHMFSILKNELKQREGVWSRIHWEIVGPIKIQTLQGRMASTDAKNIDNAYIQLTLKISSNQKFGAFDRNGNLVAGDPEKQIAVEDIWVFETKLGLPDTKWKLCARVTL